MVGVDTHGREQPLQLALRLAAAEALVEAAGRAVLRESRRAGFSMPSDPD